jgi:hypothetical protein
MLVVRVGEVVKDGAIRLRASSTRYGAAAFGGLRSLTTSLLRQNALAVKFDAESRFHMLAPGK